ncbi:MAG TPA: hypothetical protein VFZ25_05970 [Chloroflexota bacterium]|nr:hypothetical protein [Chloroflexota bacterium]
MERVRMFGFNHKEPGDDIELPKSPLEQLPLLKPGDAVAFWGAGNRVVTTRLDCQETVNDETYNWTWWFLDDQSILEVSLDGQFHYTNHEIAHQGGSLYQTLVAQDGALVHFEERVRDETVADRPVHVTLGEHEYRVASTGTFTVVNRQGPAPRPIPWQGIGNRADDNVYFSLVRSDDENAVALGIWTNHVCLSYGTPIDDTSITEVFRAK